MKVCTHNLNGKCDNQTPKKVKAKQHQILLAGKIKSEVLESVKIYVPSATLHGIGRLRKARSPQLICGIVVARVYLELVAIVDAPVRQIQAHI